MLLVMLTMIRKPIIELTQKRYIVINVMHVFRCNFNDTYYLEELKFDLDEVYKDELVWIDPYLGRSKINDSSIAILSCKDEELIILEKKKNTTKEHVIERGYNAILCEDYDKSLLLASHIHLRSS